MWEIEAPTRYVAAGNAARPVAQRAQQSKPPVPAFAARLAAAGPEVSRRARRVAIHEAGHAVAMLSKRLRPDGAVIRLQEHAHGAYISGECFFPGGRNQTAQPSPRAVSYDPAVNTDIVFCLMGGLAAEQIAGYSTEPRTHNDWDAASRLLSQYGQRRRLIDEQLVEARAVLQRDWPAVQAIAGKLFDFGDVQFQVTNTKG